MRAALPTANQVAESPLSLVGDTPSSAREHGCDHVDGCQHAEELTVPPTAAKLLQPPFAAEAAQTLRPSADQWMSASVQVRRWVLARRDAYWR